MVAPSGDALEFFNTIPWGNDLAAKSVWDRLRQLVGEVDGVCFYKHPNLGAPSGRSSPDFVVLGHGFAPLVIRCIRYNLEEIESLDDSGWTINGHTIDSPLSELDDFKLNLKYRFDSERRLRNKIHAYGLLALPHISRHDFVSRFGRLNKGILSLWQDEQSNPRLPRQDPELSAAEWRSAKSVLQSASPLSSNTGPVPGDTTTLGAAIRVLEKEIALLDTEQTKVAHQIPPGPQRIRGLAGTGKTVLLAMKAANIHGFDPDARILFTFNTQSLYNQAERLITNFYRLNNAGNVPDWSRLHIRHGWGGSARAGVYSDLCARQGVQPVTFRAAKSRDSKIPFRACCVAAMEQPIHPEYDFVLVDEAQDFPREFFPLLWQLSKEPHRIYFAYDELQSLSSIEMPSPEALFGTDERGTPRFSLDDEYPGAPEMDKDLVLLKSYRCPHDVLMLAHGVGLGIHGPNGPVQMLFDRVSWEAVGYELEEPNELVPGDHVVLYRPPANSPNRIKDIYKGELELVTIQAFPSREDEMRFVADAVVNDVRNEGVPAEQIVVISLDSINARTYMVDIQRLLQQQQVASTIPGLLDNTAEFAEPGRVTLSTVYRAKGNEAPIIYIVSFDSLASYADEVETRNRAFTCISRSKGWVRISGAGPKMKAVTRELNAILGDLPRLRFRFPSPEQIQRRLDARETSRRRRAVRQAQSIGSQLKGLDVGALAELGPDELEEIETKIRKAREALGESE